MKQFFNKIADMLELDYITYGILQSPIYDLRLVIVFHRMSKLSHKIDL